MFPPTFAKKIEYNQRSNLGAEQNIVLQNGLLRLAMDFSKTYRSTSPFVPFIPR